MSLNKNVANFRKTSEQDRAYLNAEDHPWNWISILGFWAIVVGVGSIAMQAYVWLRYGIWPPASPIAIWSYLNDGWSVLQEHGSWSLRDGWAEEYRQGIAETLSWVGVSKIAFWALSQHIIYYSILFGWLGVLAWLQVLGVAERRAARRGQPDQIDEPKAS